MKLKNVRRARRGFSLVELLAVVLILAVLAGVAIPMYLNSRSSAAQKTCASNIAAIKKAVSVNVLETGTLPATWTTTFPAALLGSAKTGGLGAAPTCPLQGTAYTGTLASGVLTIECADHAGNAATVTAPNGQITGL